MSRDHHEGIQGGDPLEAVDAHLGGDVLGHHGGHPELQEVLPDDRGVPDAGDEPLPGLGEDRDTTRENTIALNYFPSSFIPLEKQPFF